MICLTQWITDQIRLARVIIVVLHFRISRKAFIVLLLDDISLWQFTSRRVLTLPGLSALQRWLIIINLIARQLYAQNSPNSRKIKYWLPVDLCDICTFLCTLTNDLRRLGMCLLSSTTHCCFCYNYHLVIQ